MRALMAVVALALIATANAAGAADLKLHRVAYYPTSAVRAPRLVVYDAEPGTEFRAYWASPWQGRHYYPFTGKKPKVGRLENLNAPRVIAQPAPTFYQEWSTISLYPPHVTLPPADIEPAVDPVAPPK